MKGDFIVSSAKLSSTSSKRYVLPCFIRVCILYFLQDLSDFYQFLLLLTPVILVVVLLDSLLRSFDCELEEFA